jgi:hypothetical protein
MSYTPDTSNPPRCPRCKSDVVAVFPAAERSTLRTEPLAYRCMYCGWLGDDEDLRQDVGRRGASVLR